VLLGCFYEYHNFSPTEIAEIQLWRIDKEDAKKEKTAGFTGRFNNNGGIINPNWRESDTPECCHHSLHQMNKLYE